MESVELRIYYYIHF